MKWYTLIKIIWRKQLYLHKVIDLTMMTWQKRSSKMSESSDKLFENWIKSGMALKYTEEGLLPFVEEVLEHQHETIYKTVLSNSIDKTECNDCFVQNILECYTPKICSGGAKRCTFHDKNEPTKPYRQCPRNHCNRVKYEIVASHRHRTTFFKNTRSEQWCDSSWEVAKCFISNPWYTDKKSARDNTVASRLCYCVKMRLPVGKGLLHMVEHSMSFERRL